MSLTAADFPRFFEALWGYPSFPWQTRLAEQVCTKGWPEALDLPTASGKTAAIDVGLFHLALEADRGSVRQAPTRIVFVVDRRLVVDGAFERAQTIAKELARAEDGVLQDVAEALRTLGGEAEPLSVVRLRGGMPHEPDWVRSPAQPTVVLSTVDQVGSRLLFRGYGVSASMRPIHAGLLGSDALFLLDEAHLSQPFVETLGWVRRYRDEPWAEKRPGPFAVVHLSATLAPGDTEPWRLDFEDRSHELLGRRLAARKPAALVKVNSSLENDPEALAEAFGTRAQALAERDPTAFLIAIVVNRVALARAIHDALERRLRNDGDEPSADVTLLIGRSRPLDRQRLLTDVLPRMRAGRADILERPLYVVATQCVEAGADLDFDALVTQVAPLDCLRQRFGRVDRLGQRHQRKLSSHGVILAAADEVGKKAHDPIYGSATTTTWEWLSANTQGDGKEKVIDFGVQPTDERLAQAGGVDAGLLAPRLSAPVMLPAYVDAFAQTWPAPGADPEVALFLHGPDAAPADVQIVWRADIDQGALSDRYMARDVIALCPPSSLEALSVPVGAARAWLDQASHGDDTSDVEGRNVDARESDRSGGRRALRWRGGDDPATKPIWPNQLRPGDLIIVPSTYGGCDRFGWNPRGRQAVTDLAFEAQIRHRRQLILRLHPALLRQELAHLNDPQASAHLWRRVADAIVHFQDDKDALLDELEDLDQLPVAWRRTVQQLLQPRRIIDLVYPYGEPHRGAIIWARRRLSSTEVRGLLGELNPEAADAVKPATEDDAGSFGAAPIALLKHCAHVEQRARDFARRAGVSPERVDDIALAAQLHDLGKAEERFQIYLRGGDELAWLADPKTLAKSEAKASRSEMRRAAQRARLPLGSRHECWSVRLAESHPAMGALSPERRDLVLWLIGTHHGRGRPFFPPIVDEAGESRVATDLADGTRLEAPIDHGLMRLDSGWVERFERLKRCYGVWELAHMEAIVRLADHRASEAEGAS